MAKSLSRRVSAHEATISSQQQDSIRFDAQYECLMCVNRLIEPVLISCGHHFCRKCISSWLRKGNTFCPIDNKLLIESDIFPDKLVRSGTMKIRHICRSNTMSTCQSSISQPELRIATIIAQQKSENLECTFKSYGCGFRTSSQISFDVHLEKQTATHLSMLLKLLDKNKELATKSIETTNQWQSFQKDSSTGDNKTTENLMKSLFGRIVTLEQEIRDKDLKIEKLTQQISRFCTSSDVHSKYSQGVLIWRITEFQNKIQIMSTNPNKMFYSAEAYTSPYGYKFCARINISPKVKDAIGLHVHLMQSENDFHLDWPFRGRIKISMIHKNISETKHDIIMSKPEILAFHRPAQDISPRGFGFIEYANISTVLTKGFVVMDTLTIKIQLSIV